MSKDVVGKRRESERGDGNFEPVKSTVREPMTLLVLKSGRVFKHEAIIVSTMGSDPKSLHLKPSISSGGPADRCSPIYDERMAIQLNLQLLHSA